MQTLSVKNINLIAAVALALGVIFDYLFFDKFIGVSFVIYTGLLLAGLFFLFSLAKVGFNRATLWYVAPILFFSLMVGVRDSGFLIFWNVVLTAGLLIVFAHHLVGKSIKDYALFNYVETAVVLPFKMLAKAFGALGQMLTIRKGFKDSQKASQVIKGIVITFPLFIFFLVLMSSADLVFGRLVSSIFSFQLDSRAVNQVWLALFFAIIWLGAYAYILENASVRKAESPAKKDYQYKFGSIEAGILFGALNFLFLVFVIIQVKYLFAGQNAITQFGYTYAEYAHKGFAELIIIALLAFALIFAADRYIERKEGGRVSLFSILASLLVILVLVVMASAFLRLSLYEQVYSFTLLRILVQAFIIWLAVVFLWLLGKVLLAIKENIFIFGIFVSVVAFFAVLNIFNLDAFIARKNIEQFAQNGGLDTMYLRSLSADAVPEIMKLVDNNKAGLKDKQGNSLPFAAAAILKDKKDDLEKLSNLWQSYNFSRDKALRLIQEHK